MSTLALFLVASASAATPPDCKDGALIDLNVNPVVSVDPGSDEAIVSIVEVGKPATYDPSPLAPPVGFVASSWSFTAEAYLETKGLTRGALERGGFVRLQHGIELESDGGYSTDCLLTYDAAPVEVRLAEEKLAAAKKRVTMQSVMVCDPDGTREHTIKAPSPASALKVPPGQAAQGDGSLIISVSADGGDHSTLGQQTVKLAGGKFVSAASTVPGVFCDARSFADLCVNTEAVFSLTKGAPFSVSVEVDWYEMVLSECTVSR
ncbi:MAG: hypothetical protein Q8P18_17750 [Pseudomonadota bacterium]|nr:hypothetical protein [Pseudomonadota bacterium]